MTHHLIVLDNAGDYSKEQYGILYKSRNVYSTTKSSAPTRLVVWENIRRPNPRNGEPVRYGDYGALDGGDGRWLDPSNRATDDPISFLLTPESSTICSNTNMNTGQPGSGQVYATGRLADQDTATLSYPNGETREIVLHFPPHRNGHGYATLA